MNCPKGCGAEVTITEGQVFERHQENGQYLILDGRVVVLTGKPLIHARRMGLQMYVRHNVKCPRFWEDR